MAYLDFLKGSRIKLKTSQFIHVSLGLLNVTTDIWIYNLSISQLIFFVYFS